MAIKKEKKENLKGSGRKGGTRFPNYSLKQLLPFLKELIGKTQSKSISIDQLNAGVFKLKPNSVEGSIKYSSLKQYGLADGEYKNITYKPLASDIELSFNEDKIQHLQKAFYNVPTFKKCLETYQNSNVDRAKIKSYIVSSLKIHIDLAEKFLKSLIESAEVANLCTVNGNEINFGNTKAMVVNDMIDDDDNGDDNFDETEESDENLNSNLEENLNAKNENGLLSPQNNKFKNNRPNIDLKIDPTLDADKLEKQLKVLKKYGLI